MLDLVADGAITPSAEDVAARAGVGLRSVFRHFRDMESLYREMSARLAQQYDSWQLPFESADWRGRLAETVDRRLTTYERLMPFKRAADAHRHESQVLQSDYAHSLAIMRSRLESILPEGAVADRALVESLDLLLSFEVWQRLRSEQHLPVADARAVIETQILKLTRGIAG